MEGVAALSRAGPSRDPIISTHNPSDLSTAEADQYLQFLSENESLESDINESDESDVYENRKRSVEMVLNEEAKREVFLFVM